MTRMLLAAAFGLAAAAAPAAADDESALMEFSFLKPEAALALAEGALRHCHDAGYQVAVTVVDRFGLEQVMLRDRFAGPHTVSTATRKAWTAVSFRAPTLELAAMTESDPQFAGLREVTGALLLGGGLPVEAGGAIVGGIGVSGAPSPVIDEECARAGLDAVAHMLDF